MLGKLIGHEWKGTYKVGCLLLACMVGATFIGWLGFQGPMWQAAFSNSYYYGFGLLDLLSIGTFLLYVIALMGVLFGLLIYLGIRFYRTMYTDEGYLLHTLPVTKHQILISKVLVSSIWIIIIYVALALSVFVLVASLVSAALAGEYTFVEVWTEAWNEVGRQWSLASPEIRADVIRLLLYLVYGIIVGPFCMIMFLFGAITLGQLFTKHRVLMAIVFYIGMGIVRSIVEQVVQGTVTAIQFKSAVSDYDFLNAYMGSTWNVSFILDLVLAVVLYLVSYQIISRRLNME